MIALRNLKKDLYRSMREPLYAIRTLGRRGRCYISYRFGFFKSAMPESVTLFLTHNCNLNCKMCGQTGVPGPRNEISLDVLKKILDDVALFRPNITLYGGEPFLHKSIGPLIEYIKSKGLHLCVITNGTLLEDYAGLIVANGVDTISVSIDGPEELHDGIRGVEGAFGRIERSLASINDKKHSSGGKKPRINIVFTMSKFNYKHLADMPGIAKRLGADTLNFHHLIFLDEDTADRQDRLPGTDYGRISRDWEGFAANDAGEINTEILIKNINRLKNTRTGFLVNFYPNFTDEEVRRYYSGGRFSPSGYRKRCLSPWMTAYVYPDGVIKPCLALDYTAGDTGTDSFADIWSGGRFNKFRSILKKSKCLPVCERCTELYRY